MRRPPGETEKRHLRMQGASLRVGAGDMPASSPFQCGGMGDKDPRGEVGGHAIVPPVPGSEKVHLGRVDSGAAEEAAVQCREVGETQSFLRQREALRDEIRHRAFPPHP